MQEQNNDAPVNDNEDELPTPILRAAAGGTLMGLANLVPGISGGTMLLAAGIYPRFIRAIAELSTLKFRRASILVLGTVALCAAAAIFLLAGPVKDLVVEYRWVMYSLFIGLTLGGVPIVWKMARPAETSLWGGALIGFLGMAALAYVQMSSPGGAATNQGMMMMFFAGVAGASAMILPGVSGGYLLLVMGVYVPILSGIESLKDALKTGDLGAAITPGVEVVLPVGIGVLIGVLVVSNGLQYLLKRFEKPTLGALLGLLVGAVVGLWPFQRGVAPELGSIFRGREVTAERLAELEPSKFPTEVFSPSVAQVAGALVLIALGYLLTTLVARLGQDKPSKAG
jgi:putative membrane protein